LQSRILIAGKNDVGRGMSCSVPRYFHHSYNGMHEDLQSGITRDLSNKESIFRNRPSPLVIVASLSLSLSPSLENYSITTQDGRHQDQSIGTRYYHITSLHYPSHIYVSSEPSTSTSPSVLISYSFFPLAPSLDYHSSHWPPQLSISLFRSFFLIQSPSPSTFLANQP
jgi:hypothetical protein